MKLRQLLNITKDKVTIINMNEKLDSNNRFVCKNYISSNDNYEDEEPYYNFLDWEVISIEKWKDSICYRII